MDVPSSGLHPSTWSTTWPAQSAALRRTWHLVGSDRDLQSPGSWAPFVLLPGCLDEPILVTRTDDGLQGFANVCTHRGATLVDGPGRGKAVRCPYHGRAFDLAGRCLASPGFTGTPGFPAPADHLPRVDVGTWQGFVFASVDPVVPFAEVIAPVAERLAFLDLREAVFSGQRDYYVDGHFAAWCENYLEGFHVPFVHPGLDRVLERSSYRTEVGDWASVQMGFVGPGEPGFAPPAGHPEHGRRVGGYYAALFPLTMINAYPWGVSLNLVQPLGPDATRIRYQSWVVDASLRDRGAGADLDTVELEDQAIVARVLEGWRSSRVQAPRFAPGLEDGVAHWHGLWRRFLEA